MIERAYTLEEIDRMRRLLEDIMFPTIWHSRRSGVVAGGCFNEGARKLEIEDRLRTLMMAGVRVGDLEEEAKLVAERSEERRLSFPEVKHR